MLVRTDPDRGRTSFLSIPRDLRVDVPGHGFAKINAAYQFGGPDLAVQTVKRLHRPAGQPHRRRRLPELRAADRRARRREDRRARADRLEPVRLPVPDAGTLPALERLALRRGRADDERPPRARLLPRPREPAQPCRERPDARRAPAGRSSARSATTDELLDARAAAVPRGRPDRAARDRPLRRAVRSARLGSKSAPARACAAGSAARRRRSAASRS